MSHAGSDFIELFDGALDAAFCRSVIDKFDHDERVRRGHVGSGIDVSLKDSWDICLDDHPDWNWALQRLNGAMAQCLKRYLLQYPHTLLAPITLKMAAPAGGEPVLLTPKRVAGLSAQHMMALITKVFRPGTINVQKYRADEGGYPYWHCELYPKADGGETLHRVLLWSVYLNDEFEYGETEFYHQRRKIAPRTGSLLIAPAGFTHTHRGNRPHGGDKYLATSWILFQPAERIYGSAKQ